MLADSAQGAEADVVQRDEPLVGVIVLNWNRWTETTRCVDAVAASSYRRVHLVVVDNASRESPPRDIALRDGVQLVQTGSNLGYAGGNNLGIRAALSAGAAYVWVLNNDAIPDPSALAELVDALEAEAAWGAVTSRIVDSHGEDDPGLVIPASHGPWDPVAPHTPTAICSEGVRGRVVEVGYPRGPSLFFRRAALEEVGVFDERYFHYFEEMDLMERLRRAGWKLGMACSSIVVHEKGASLPYDSPQSVYYLHRNHFRFEQKLFGTHPLRVVLRHPIRRVRALLALRMTLRGDIRPLVAQIRAFADALRGRSGPIDLGERYLEPVPRRRRK